MDFNIYTTVLPENQRKGKYSTVLNFQIFNPNIKIKCTINHSNFTNVCEDRTSKENMF